MRDQGKSRIRKKVRLEPLCGKIDAHAYVGTDAQNLGLRDAIKAF